MSRHRNVRQMNYDEEYDDYYTDMAGSVEDESGFSPSSVEKEFMYDRSRQLHSMASFIQSDVDTPSGEQQPAGDSRRVSLDRRDSTEPAIRHITGAELRRLTSCLDQIRDVVGDTVAEHQMVDAIIRSGFVVERALDTILSSAAAGMSVSDSPVVKKSPSDLADGPSFTPAASSSTDSRVLQVSVLSHHPISISSGPDTGASLSKNRSAGSDISLRNVARGSAGPSRVDKPSPLLAGVLRSSLKEHAPKLRPFKGDSYASSKDIPVINVALDSRSLLASTAASAPSLKDMASSTDSLLCSHTGPATSLKDMALSTGSLLNSYNGPMPPLKSMASATGSLLGSHTGSTPSLKDIASSTCSLLNSHGGPAPSLKDIASNSGPLVSNLGKPGVSLKDIALHSGSLLSIAGGSGFSLQSISLSAGSLLETVVDGAGPSTLMSSQLHPSLVSSKTDLADISSEVSRITFSDVIPKTTFSSSAIGRSSEGFDLTSALIAPSQLTSTDVSSTPAVTETSTDPSVSEELKPQNDLPPGCGVFAADPSDIKRPPAHLMTRPSPLGRCITARFSRRAAAPADALILSTCSRSSTSPGGVAPFKFDTLSPDEVVLQKQKQVVQKV